MEDFEVGGPPCPEDEVIAVHQDPLARTARRTVHTEKADVWACLLVDGIFAVAVENRFPFTRKIRVDFVEAGFKPQKDPNCDGDIPSGAPRR